ncbi:MAG: sulfatase family protein [Verrucomicrobiales bacterium]
MPARQSLFRLLLVLAASFSACPIATAEDSSTAKPNIVVILADDVGWGDPSCYGASKFTTPNLDRLARDGQRFLDGHASAAVCTPTRYSMLTGQYSWRRDVSGLNKGVAQGAAPLLIPTDMPTAPGLLKADGYRTAVIGKWHLGFGKTKPDYNAELRPGPLEIGFHEYFGFPATNDRIPTVLIRDHKVVGLDPSDPIEYTYKKEEATAKGLTQFAAGRNRIGYAKGGESAWWKDTELADTFTRESVKFIERNKDKNFFLLFTPHDVHAPVIPHPRFVGKSGVSMRADMLMELDWSVGQILDTLDKHGLAKNTLVIFSSDNGAYVKKEPGHLPNGPYSGEKSQLWEGGHRVPFICRWPARLTPGVSDKLVSTLDIPATICAAAGLDIPAQALPDSFNLLPGMLGEKNAPEREHLVVMSGNGHLALRSANLKYMPDLAFADGWKGGGQKKPGAKPRPALFDLSKDPGEKENLFGQRAELAGQLAKTLAAIQSATKTRPE